VEKKLIKPMKLQIQRKIIHFFVFLISLLSSNNFGLDCPNLKYGRNQSAFQHDVTVTVKLIQVYVTDKAGIPVTDLEKDDFEIYDQRERKTITEFERHLLSLPEITKEIPKKPKMPPPRSKMNRKFILFFDFAFNNAKGILKSKEAALHFVNTKLIPEDEVSVLSYSVSQGITIHEFLTTRHDKVQKVIEGFGAKDIAGRAYNIESRYWRITEEEKERRREYPLADYSQFLGWQDVLLDRSIYKAQASRFSLKMEELSKALRYISGYKHILFFSSGVASTVMSNKLASMEKSRVRKMEPGLGESIILSRYENMLKALTNSNCVVYTINTERLESLIQQDADTLGTSSLKRLSKKTGGEYYKYAADYETIMEDLQNRTGSYYVLGYYVREKWDGRYHKLDVKVKKKGCKVHAQGGYYEKKPFTEYSKLEKQLHLVDLALTERPLFQDPVHFPLEATWSLRDEAYTLIMQFPLTEENLYRISGRDVEIVSLVFDEKDDVVEMNREEMDFSKQPSWDFLHTSKLSVPPGRYKCRVVIRNLETGRGAVGACEVNIPEM